MSLECSCKTPGALSDHSRFLVISFAEAILKLWRYKFRCHLNENNPDAFMK